MSALSLYWCMDRFLQRCSGLGHNHQKVAAERSVLSLSLRCALRVSAAELAGVEQSYGGTISALSLYRHSAPPLASRAPAAVHVTSFLSPTSSGSLQVSSPRRSSIWRERETKDAPGSVICAVACSRLRVPDSRRPNRAALETGGTIRPLVGVRSVAGVSWSGDSGRRSPPVVWSWHVVLCGCRSPSQRPPVAEKGPAPSHFSTNPPAQGK